MNRVVVCMMFYETKFTRRIRMANNNNKTGKVDKYLYVIIVAGINQGIRNNKTYRAWYL